MIRLGQTYQHLVHGSGCGCSSPALSIATARLERQSRRGFLAGLGAAAVATTLPAPGFAQSQPPKILFTNVRLFDGKTENLTDGASVLVEGDRIAAVDTSNNPPPEGANVIDGGGRVLMPGLIDAHWHAIFAALPLQVLLTADPGIIFAAATAEANRTLLRGFTTVRDLGGPTFSFKQAIDGGLIPGPRIFPSGAMITTSGGHGDLRLPTEIPRDGHRLSSGELFGAGAIADSVGDLKMRIREQFLQGASQVKITAGGGVSSPRSPLDMLTYSEEELRAAAEVARDWNSYLTVHAYMPKTVQRAVAAGVPCVEHGHLIDEETARLLAEKEVWLSTQPFMGMEDSSATEGVGAERAQRVFEGTRRLYEWIAKCGIRTAWGSDMLFSARLAERQSQMLTHLGNFYSNAAALKMATSTNAELLALSNERKPYPHKLGVIEPDAYADLLLVDGNPLEDLHLLDRPAETLAVIMKGGVAVKREI